MRETVISDLITRRDALQRMGLLAGGALSTPLLSGVLAGCRAAPPSATFAPQTLEADQYKLVETLTEIILPTTDTPGARDAGVPAFIDQMLTTWYPEEDRTEILTGIQRLDEHAQTVFGSPFVEAIEAQQTTLVEAMASQAFVSAEAENQEPPADPLPAELTDLFRHIKQLTVVGYYTSEMGATQELRVSPMGAYDGDIPYERVGRAWS